jgi:hypothetical protein
LKILFKASAFFCFILAPAATKKRPRRGTRLGAGDARAEGHGHPHGVRNGVNLLRLHFAETLKIFVKDISVIQERYFCDLQKRA